MLINQKKEKFQKAIISILFETEYTYVFWCANYESDSESWRKFDFYDENYKKLIKIMVYLGK